MFELSVPFFIYCCYRWGDWRNWRIYYPTILYMIMVNFLTNFLTAQYPLWEYNNKILNHTFTDFFVSSTVFPSTVILYLSHFPKKTGKQILHILLWASLYFLLELSSLKLGLFAHKNTWTLMYAAGFDVMMFIMLRFHYKHPLLTWPVSAVLMIVGFYFLKLPINSMR